MADSTDASGGGGSRGSDEDGPQEVQNRPKEHPGGTIESALPGALYRVHLDDGRIVVAGIATEARRTLVKVVPGDRVAVAVSPFDPRRGKIIARQS
jgi:translation initiation factor IF-1